MKLVSILSILLLYTTTTLAQHDTHHDDSHDTHNNHLALFVGNTSQHKFEQNSFSIGADYAYFFPKSKRWGISVFGEYIKKEHPEWVFGVPVIFKPTKHLWLRAGAGIELARTEDEHADIHSKPIVRLGAGYNINLNKLVLSPSLDVDFIRKHAALVAGINIGFGF